MSNTDNTPINQDQSNKSKNGHKFNDVVTEHLQKWHDGVERFFVGAEQRAYGIKTVNMDQDQIFGVTFDHLVAIKSHIQNTILLAPIDNTTTIRERTSQKALEGVSLQVLKDSLKNKFLEKYPQFDDYNFTCAMTLGIPDHLDPTLKKLLSEEKTVHETIVGINYKTDGDWSSNQYKDGLDFAARMSDITKILDYILANQHTHILDRGILARTWVEVYGTTYENMPICSLNLSKANRQRDYLIWGLENRANEYDAKHGYAPLDRFLNMRGIKYNKSATNAQKIQLIIQDLKANFPPQVDFNILKDVEDYHNQLRSLGKL